MLAFQIVGQASSAQEVDLPFWPALQYFVASGEEEKTVKI